MIVKRELSLRDLQLCGKNITIQTMSSLISRERKVSLMIVLVAAS